MLLGGDRHQGRGGGGGGWRCEGPRHLLAHPPQGGQGGGGGRPEGSTNSSEKFKLTDIKDVKAFANLYNFLLAWKQFKTIYLNPYYSYFHPFLTPLNIRNPRLIEFNPVDI